MKQRIITGVLLVVVVFTFLIYATDYLFGVGVFLVAILAAIEWLKFADTPDCKTSKELVVFGVTTLIVSGFFEYVMYIFPIFWLYAIYKLNSMKDKK